MPHYIALIHKDSDSSYGVSFPDVPGAPLSSPPLRSAPSKLTFDKRQRGQRRMSPKFPGEFG